MVGFSTLRSKMGDDSDSSLAVPRRAGTKAARNKF